ncbi:MAG: L,D-transpeptidase family protein [Akkermansia sp.]|nr:L,D-transpeptidase family protein [Akkermansia sp.]
MNASLNKWLRVVTAAVLLASCQQQAPLPQRVTPMPEAVTPYERFVSSSKAYPTVMEIYLDDALLKEADSRSRIVICLDQQRGRLYVNGKVAADWPVSTGADSHLTPTGHFRVRFKEKEHYSNRYGKMYDASGKCIDNNADVFTQPIPEGGRFDGSPMPNWMRLTYDGIGMHTGKVKAGRRLSHGCIRLPHVVSTMLFDIVKIGSRVVINQEVEPEYPVNAILARRDLEAADSSQQPEPEELWYTPVAE